MDALVSAFVAALLAEIGDRTQLLVVALAAFYRRPGPVLAGAAVAAAASSLIAAAIGAFIAGIVTGRAVSLLLALACVFAGIAGLIRPRETRASFRGNPFIVALLAVFAAELGDKSQFLAGAIAARFDSLAFAAAGATLGIVAANIPAALLGERLRRDLPLGAIRIVGAALFLVTGFVLAATALGLI